MSTMIDMEKQLRDGCDAWFEELSRLAGRPLDGEGWTARWFDGYSPAEALKIGPEEGED